MLISDDFTSSSLNERKIDLFRKVSASFRIIHLENLENKTMVYQVSTRFLDHGLSFWKKITFSSKKPWSTTGKVK